MEESKLSKNGKLRRKGQFKPGQSGNIFGRPRSDYALRNIAKEHTAGALHTLLEISQDRSVSPRTRVAAAIELLNRGWGASSPFAESMRLGESFYDGVISIIRGQQMADTTNN
jgi:hypothetical protein